MPLIKPEIARALREVGISKKGEKGEAGFEKALSEAGLSTEALAEELTSLALRNQNDMVRMRALETALKIKGALKESTGALPSFNITIHNSSTSLSETQGANPINFPRQSYQVCEVAKESQEDEETSEESEDEVYGHLNTGGFPGRRSRIRQ